MISLVSTVRAPLADLERFVAYHLNTGVGRIHLFFDDPVDPALAAFQGRESVETTACTAEHWRDAGLKPADGIEARQTYNATLALARARAQGDRWLLSIDSDELIYTAGGDLAAWLAHRDPDVEAVILPAWEAIPRPDDPRHPFEACRLFKVPPTSQQLTWAGRAGCRSALRYGYFCGHMAGKSATRVDSTIDRIGIHAPVRSDGFPVNLQRASDAATLHYDSCTFESWRDKWARRKDGSGLALNMRPDRARQFRDFRAADLTGSLAALKREFRRQRLIPAHEQVVLRLLGLARPLHLPQGLFAA